MSAPITERSAAEAPPAPAKGRAWLAALLLVLVAVGLQWLWVAVRQSRQPTGKAAWIWTGDTNRWTGPRTAWTFRDFDLESVPERAAVTVLGDEEYVLYLNGERVGSNRYTPAAPPDRYEVGPLLAAGRNRFAAELRSSRGFGGFLLALSAAGADEPMVITDGSWQISTQRFKRLFRPDLEIGERLAATVLERPPFGRWGSMSGARERPLHAAVRLAYRPLRPARVFFPDRGWERIGRRTGGGGIELAPRVLLDWGNIVDGYLTFALPEDEPVVALAYLGLTRPDPVRNPPDARIIGTPGQPYWEDVVPRRFRYALVVGAGAATDVQVVLTDEEAIEPVLAGAVAEGVLGRPAPRLVSPLEDEVWRELEGFPRRAER